MKRIILLLLPIFVLFTSCEDNRRQGLCDDTIYLVKNGKQEVVISRDEPTTVAIWATKAGYMKQTVNVVYTVDEQALEGTGYTLVPENCYSVSGWNFSISEVGGFAKFNVTFNPDRIIASGITEKIALPLRITTDGAEVIEGKDLSIVVVSLEPEE